MDGWSWGALALLLAATVVVAWGLFSPAKRLPAWAHHHDKWWHAIAFAGLAFLAYGVFPSHEAFPWLLWLVLSALGVATEGLQHRFAPGRSFSWGDALANTAGAAVGLWAAVPIWHALRTWMP